MTILAPVRTPAGPTPLGRAFAAVVSGAGCDRVLDGMVFKALEEAPGDDWAELPLGEDDVWHRRDPADSAAFDAPPRYVSDATAAFAAIRIAPDDHFELTFREGRWEARINEAASGEVLHARASGPERAVVALELLRRDHAAARSAKAA